MSNFSLPLEGKVPRNEADEVSESKKKQKLNFIKSAPPHHRLRRSFPSRGSLVWFQQILKFYCLKSDIYNQKSKKFLPFMNKGRNFGSIINVGVNKKRA